MQWPPNYRRIILEPGDEYALHNGGKGGLRVGPPQIREAGDEPVVLSDELRAALEDALEDVDFDGWPGPAD